MQEEQARRRNRRLHGLLQWPFGGAIEAEPGESSMETANRTRAVAPAGIGAVGSTTGLPADLLEQAASRLGVVSLVYAITYSVAFYPAYVVNLLGADVPILPGRVEHIAAAISIAASLGVFVLVRFVPVSPTTLLDLGLVYEVIASFGIAVAEFWGVGFEGHLAAMEAGGKPWFGISWVCTFILTFPILVPNTPGKTLLAAMASASMAPFALLLSLAFGASDGAPGFLWSGLAISVYGSATIAYVSSRYIYGLGRNIREARDLGSYRLVEQLGAGGMGEVWKAEHQMLARPAAIKLIRHDRGLGSASEEDARRRFEREARATARLRSPHTVELYDFGLTHDGRFYYAMELLDGVDLETFVGRFGPLPAARAVDWLQQACDSLAEAHQRGMVHRDIKPANLYVCRLGTNVDFIKVLDFGLVKPSRFDVETRLTADGLAAGTPAYMAPEMAEGIGNVDHLVDIYALGCVGYWLLTGATVFAGDNPLKMVVDHVQTVPAPPSQRAELTVPAAVDEVILACLEKVPANRPQSAVELAQMLHQCGLERGWSRLDAMSWWSMHLPEAAGVEAR